MTDRLDSGGALEGVVVVDFTQMLSGPFCTMLLADQGARQNRGASHCAPTAFQQDAAKGSCPVL